MAYIIMAYIVMAYIVMAYTQLCSFLGLTTRVVPYGHTLTAREREVPTPNDANTTWSQHCLVSAVLGVSSAWCLHCLVQPCIVSDTA